ncbi:hypothetical protein GGI21_000776 [Coemansia aciculifera]|nr:hypothetical protein GGI21_000776 [Coemansia aciculifera]
MATQVAHCMYKRRRQQQHRLHNESSGRWFCLICDVSYEHSWAFEAHLELNCECTKVSNYDKYGLLKDPECDRIVECGPLCKCADKCVNRIVQRGSKAELELRRYEHKGWGVVTKKPLPRGVFVAEYLGEVISTDEAERRGKNEVTANLTYLYDLDKECTGAGDISDFCVDAKTHGNISRFFNHSCEPNMQTYAVYTEHRDPRLHRLAIFTNCDIEAGEELTIDYSPGSKNGEGLQVNKCYCGTSKCRKFMFY